MIKEFTADALPQCAALFMRVFNEAPWYNCWTAETAHACLRELAESKRFFGFTLWEDDTLLGAAFCHAKTYCKGDDAFVDELFVSPDSQRRGCGKALMEAVEAYAKAHALVSISLLTDKEYPSFAFFKERGFRHAGYMVFMHKRMD